MSNILSYFEPTANEFQPAKGVAGGVRVVGIDPLLRQVTTAATTNATAVKNAPGGVFNIDITNTTASTIFVKLYNLATDPTVGTSVPVMTIPVAANSFVTYEFGFLGRRFTTGISLAVTGAMAATDTTAVGAGAYVGVTYF